MAAASAPRPRAREGWRLRPHRARGGASSTEALARDDEVEAVEGRADGVGPAPVREGVVGEARDGQRLGEGREVGHREHRRGPEASRAAAFSGVARRDEPQRAVREDVVEAPYAPPRVRREEHALRRHLGTPFALRRHGPRARAAVSASK